MKKRIIVPLSLILFLFYVPALIAQESNEIEVESESYPSAGNLVLITALRGGVAVPLANFPEAYLTNVCAGLNLGVKLSEEVMILAVAMYENLTTAANGKVIELYNFSIDFRYTLVLSELFYLYMQVGPAVFTRDFSNIDFGYTGGLGLGLEIYPEMNLELGADYFSTATQNNLQLLIHFGVIVIM